MEVVLASTYLIKELLGCVIVLYVLIMAGLFRVQGIGVVSIEEGVSEGYLHVLREVFLQQLLEVILGGGGVGEERGGKEEGRRRRKFRKGP